MTKEKFTFLITCLCLSISYTGMAQQCQCGKEFSFLKSYIETNYPGFTDKTPEYKGLNYNRFTAGYQALADSEKNITYCMMFMKEWLKYFKDEHLQITANPLIGNDSEILSTRIKNKEILDVSPEKLAEIKKSKGVEGIYYEDDSVYKVAVIKSPTSWRTYAAVVLESKNKNWTAGMVKFELKDDSDSILSDKKWYPCYPAIFYMGNHGIYTNKRMSFTGYGLDGGTWKKEGLKESAKEQAQRNKRNKERRNAPPKEWNYVEFRQQDQQCTYMRISNFDSKIADEIDSFVAGNDSAISNTPYLILDLRGNTGGSDRSFQALLPYIYTQPIVTVGMGMLATRGNIDADKAVAATITDESIQKWLQREITEMEENFGRYTHISRDTFRMDSVKRYPEKIAILVDSDCATASEQFLLAASQSSKVTIMGKTTNGNLDYSNRRPKRFPCIPYTLEYPISRSGRLPAQPVDNIGITPTVPLDNKTDWTKAAAQYLETGSISGKK